MERICWGNANGLVNGLTSLGFCKHKHKEEDGMQYMMEKYSNGLTFMAYNMPNTHSITIALFIKGGVNWESAKQRGITHFVEHLCFRRSNGFVQSDFYKRIELTGGFLRGTTYRDHVRFEMSVHPIFFKEAIDIICGVFADNFWTIKDIQKEKEVVAREIERDGYSFEKGLLNRFFTPDGRRKPIMGSLANLRRFAKKEIEAWKRRLFLPANSCFIITGPLQHMDLNYPKYKLSALENANNIINVGFTPKNFLSRSSTDDHIYYDDSSIAQIGLLFDLDKSKIRSFEADFLMNVMAAGLTSQLLMLLREELGILYEIPSGWNFCDFGGCMYFAFEVEHCNLDLLMSKLIQQFSAAKSELDKTSFECTQAYFKFGQSSLQDMPAEFARTLGESIFLYNDFFDSVESYIEKYQTVTYEKLCNVSSTVFSASNMSITVVTDSEGQDVRNLKKKMRIFREALDETTNSGPRL